MSKATPAERETAEVDSLPPWAAEVVEAEARANAEPQRRSAWLAAALVLVVGLIAIAVFVVGGGADETATSAATNNPGRAVGSPDEVQIEDAEPEPEPQVIEDIPEEAAPAQASPAPVTVAPADTDELAEGGEDTTDTDDSENAGEATDDELAIEGGDEPAEANADTGTTEETTSTAPTTTEAPAAIGDETFELQGVSNECLEAMQAATDAADPDGPPEGLDPTFEHCMTENEWLLAANFTGIDTQIDTGAWVVNGCIYNADLYTSPLCLSTIDPDTGPRRIDCADGRQPIEWPFADDGRSNSQVCDDHFQLDCDDGSIHNIPRDAMSEAEAQETICV